MSWPDGSSGAKNVAICVRCGGVFGQFGHGGEDGCKCERFHTKMGRVVPVIPLAQLERIEPELCRCQNCDHVQAEPNWCHKCRHRTSTPPWAEKLLDELSSAKDERDRLRALLGELADELEGLHEDNWRLRGSSEAAQGIAIGYRNAAALLRKHLEANDA